MADPPEMPLPTAILLLQQHALERVPVPAVPHRPVDRDSTLADPVVPQTEHRHYEAARQVAQEAELWKCADFIRADHKRSQELRQHA